MGMASFPYLPLLAILVSLVSTLVIHMSLFAYAGFMVEYFGIVNHKDKAGEGEILGNTYYYCLPLRSVAGFRT